MPNNPLEKRYTNVLEYLKFYQEMSIQFPCHDWVRKIKKTEEELEIIKAQFLTAAE